MLNRRAYGHEKEGCEEKENLEEEIDKIERNKRMQLTSGLWQAGVQFVVRSGCSDLRLLLTTSRFPGGLSAYSEAPSGSLPHSNITC